MRAICFSSWRTPGFAIVAVTAAKSISVSRQYRALPLESLPLWDGATS